MTLCILETLKKVRRFEAAFARDLEWGFMEELGLDMSQVRTLVRLGEVRLAGSVK